MDCEQVREALSARLDDEPGQVADAVVDAHLAGCTACTAWAGRLGDLHRQVRLRAAEPVPDLSAAILDRAALPAPDAPAGRPWWAPLTERVSAARWALLVVGLTQLVLAGPALLLGDDPGATAHVARELGSFDVALAAGLLVAAWQPARAWGLLPVVAILGLTTGVTALLDLADGAASTSGEAHHLLDLAGVALVWVVARQTRARRLAGRPGLAAA